MIYEMNEEKYEKLINEAVRKLYKKTVNSFENDLNFEACNNVIRLKTDNRVNKIFSKPALQQSRTIRIILELTQNACN